MSGKSPTLFVRLGLLACCIWIGSPNSLAGAEHARQLAGRLLAQGHHDAAITEFKRAIFLGAAHPDELYVHLAHAYLLMDDEYWAVESIDRAIALSPDRRSRSERNLDKGLILTYFSQHSRAIHVLIRELYFSGDPEVRCRAATLLAINHVSLGDWEEVIALEREGVVQTEHCPVFADILALLPEEGSIRYKDAGRARMLSTFLPGLGQMYAGDWMDGLNALALNGGLAAWTLTSALQGNASRSAFALMLFIRFYQGNRLNAQQAAGDYNRRINREIRNLIDEAL